MAGQLPAVLACGGGWVGHLLTAAALVGLYAVRGAGRGIADELEIVDVLLGRGCRRRYRRGRRRRGRLYGLGAGLAAALTAAGKGDDAVADDPAIPVMAEGGQLLLDDFAADRALVLGRAVVGDRSGSPACPRSPHSCVHGASALKLAVSTTPPASAFWGIVKLIVALL